jgi:hypothetical protein
MKMTIGGNAFEDVGVPVLWGNYAVLQGPDGHLSIVDLSGPEAQLILLEDEPARDTSYRPVDGGYELLDDQDKPLISFRHTDTRLLEDVAGRLPACEISARGVRIGKSFFSGAMVVGGAVGIVADERSISVGGSLPAQLAPLVI